jgi:thymidylate synthase (FAD)
MINRIKGETPLVDILNGERREIKIHEHGLVALVDVMPRMVPIGRTADYAIVQAARVSYGQGLKSEKEDRGLIRYLLRMSHSTPLEMVELKFHHVLPIFVARQLVRHRTASLNEVSARYTVLKDKFYVPTKEGLRAQSKTNKQGSSEESLDNLTYQEFIEYIEHDYEKYTNLVEKGVAKELARIGLPLNIYTEWYWKIDLHNFFHFSALRMDSHAQQEIRDYAWAMFALVQEVAPVACEAFIDYVFQGMRLSRLEIEAIRTGKDLQSDNNRETTEWEDKKGILGILS